MNTILEQDRLRKSLIVSFTTLFSCFALALVAGSILMVPSSSDAVKSDVDISIDPVLEISMSTSNLELEVTPTSGGKLVSGDVTATVGTNNATGYTLTMGATGAENVDLVHSNATDKIGNSGNSSAGALTVNSWGYNLKSGATPTTFLKIPAPTSAGTLYVSAVPEMNSATTVTLAANVNTLTASGVYSSKLTFSAVGNYVPEPAITMQRISEESCPAVRTKAKDARDGNTYWVQRMADGKCWMLTNLGYAGGGADTYGDVKTITRNESSTTYTAAHYMIPTGANPTIYPNAPSASTDGTGQYGYLYNWCAAMGAQTGTDACSSTDTTDANTSISICPSGWRLPTGNTGGEFQALNTAVNSGSTSSDSGLRSTWLGMYGGYWYTGFNYQGSSGYYWSSTQNNATYAWILTFNSSSVYPGTNTNNEGSGQSVRCIAK